ncbi:hypothetical protein PINS_up007312 [Pythium insidiosum]|nr:hypothetical protein PINS_up007312 [Pythium insidiosum]
MEQLARLEQRVRDVEEAYALERQQRDVLEKKYARLKRRYARLERVHAHVLQHAQETLSAGGSRSLELSPTPTIDTAFTSDSTPCSAVIDLTSPSAARLASRRASPVTSYHSSPTNLAAMQEYEASIRAASARAYGSSEHSTAMANQDLLQHADIDPDNMTYDELLQLGERVGDVKKEQWREVAVHVLSSLPTHRWSTSSESDVSYVHFQLFFGD